MRLLTISVVLLLCLCVFSWALEEDDPAIVGVWLLKATLKTHPATAMMGKLPETLNLRTVNSGKLSSPVVAVVLMSKIQRVSRASATN